MKFYEGLDRFTGNIAALDPKGNRLSYNELIKEADRFGASVQTDRKRLVLLLCENNFESLVGYVGALRSGAAVMLMAADIGDDLFQNLVNLYHPDYIWGAKQGSGSVVHTYGQFALTRSTDTGEPEINPNLTLLLSTSGSTGSPKMVRLTADNVDANASSIAEYLGLHDEERPITTLPMHYSFGLSIINSHLRVGATLLMTGESIVTRGFWDFFTGSQATSFSGVPYTYEILRRIKFFDKPLPSLKTLTQAGGKLTPVFAQEFAEYAKKQGIDFYIMYGQTEATARISYLPAKDAVLKYRSIGIAIPRGSLSVINDAGQAITQPDVDGELVYRGPNVMMGYAESRGDLGKGDELLGELRTGDLAHFDSDGYFYITGRLKRFIKIHGNRVNLDEVEHWLKSLGYVAACGGKDDLLCVATTDRGKGPEIATRVNSAYGFHKTVIRVIEVEEILKNSSGKIQYEQMFSGVVA